MPDDEQAPEAGRGDCDVEQESPVERRVRPYLEDQGPRPHARQEPERPIGLDQGEEDALLLMRFEMGIRGLPISSSRRRIDLACVRRSSGKH